MPSITQDAQQMSLLFQFGVLDAEAVMAWADEAIVQMERPPEALLELSTIPPDRTADILLSLHRLSCGAEFWQALRSIIPQLRDFVVSYPDRAESIANHLFHTVVGFPATEVPEDMHFTYRFDDAFSLAREGTYGDIDAVRREFVRELERFIEMG